MKGVLLRSAAAVLACVMVLSLCACNGGVYRNDDRKKNYDRSYQPTEKEPLALTGDKEEEIKNAVATLYNTKITAEYEAALKEYSKNVEAEASKVAAMSAAAESDAKLAASLAKAESRTASKEQSRKPSSSGSSSRTVYNFGSAETASVYSSPEFKKPEPPTLKTSSDVSIYTYGGTYNGYIALRYKLKGKAQVAAHQDENLESDIIGSFNFSYYPDSPIMAMYMDGKFFTVREIFESGAISEQNLKDIWYYFYVED